MVHPNLLNRKEQIHDGDTFSFIYLHGRVFFFFLLVVILSKLGISFLNGKLGTKRHFQNNIHTFLVLPHSTLQNYRKVIPQRNIINISAPHLEFYLIES
jgi:hypothetical protein